MTDDSHAVGSSARGGRRYAKKRSRSPVLGEHTGDDDPPGTLITDFQDLSSRYSDFAEALSSLKKRQKQKVTDEDSARNGSGCSRIDGVELSEDSATTESAPKKYTGKTSFSTHVDRSFNLSLTRAMLHRNFGLSLPSVPEGRLCPPVPNRFNYVLWLKELLRESADERYFVQQPSSAPPEEPPEPYRFQGIDIGTGASAIYPLLLSTDGFSPDRRWRFLATEIDETSAEAARTNIAANELQDRVKIALVTPTERQLYAQKEDDLQSGGPLQSAISAADGCSMFHRRPRGTEDGGVGVTPVCFDFVMTNPPFYSSAAEATAPRAGDGRLRTDITLSEGVYPGGELGFVRDMIADSYELRHRVTWFTSMLGKKSSLEKLERQLRTNLGKGRIRTTEFVQGKMTRWGLAWTYRPVPPRSQGLEVEGRKFEVNLDSRDITGSAVACVVARIYSFCQIVKGMDLKCSTSEDLGGSATVTITGSKRTREVKESKSDQIGERKSSEESVCAQDPATLGEGADFLIDALVQERITQGLPGKKVVEVSLSCYCHSSTGTTAIGQLRNQIVGEVQRTNRRWRRILAADSSTLSPKSRT